MHLEDYAILLGRLFGNFQSLEFTLRSFLYARADPPHSPLASGVTLDLLIVGDILPENALTDYSSLGKLIDRYNRLVAPTHPDLAIDRSIVELRDALAHGRVSTSAPQKDMTLLKFDEPSDKSARVAYSQKLTAQWMKNQVMRVHAELEKVVKVPGSPIQIDEV